MKEQNEAIEKALNEFVSNKTASELAYMGGKDLETAYHLLQEQMEYNGMMPEEPTVKVLLQGLHDLTQTQFLERMAIEEYQEILCQQVDLLANILGVELER